MSRISAADQPIFLPLKSVTPFSLFTSKFTSHLCLLRVVLEKKKSKKQRFFFSTLDNANVFDIFTYSFSVLYLPESLRYYSVKNFEKIKSGCKSSSRQFLYKPEISDQKYRKRSTHTNFCYINIGI